MISNYGGNVGCQNISNGACNINFQIDEDMAGPIEVMYSLNNFVANSR